MYDNLEMSGIRKTISKNSIILTSTRVYYRIFSLLLISVQCRLKSGKEKTGDEPKICCYEIQDHI